jgi:hypothetical protein
MPMHTFDILENGHVSAAKAEQMFLTTGPYVLAGNRLDGLQSAVVLNDSSTSVVTGIGKTTSTETVNSGSMLGRAAAGGLIAGPLGALAGAGSASREHIGTQNFVTHEKKAHSLTIHVTLFDGRQMFIVANSIEAYRWLLSLVSSKRFTDVEIERSRTIASRKQKENERWEKIDRIVGERYNAQLRSTNWIIWAAMIAGVILGHRYGDFRLSKAIFSVFFGSLAVFPGMLIKSIFDHYDKKEKLKAFQQLNRDRLDAYMKEFGERPPAGLPPWKGK